MVDATWPQGAADILWNRITSSLTKFLQIFNSTSLLSRLLGTISSGPITISITVTFMYQKSCCSLARSMYLSIFSLSFIFIQWSAETVKSTRWQVFCFCLINTWSGLLGFGDLFVSQNPRKFHESHFLVCANTTWRCPWCNAYRRRKWTRRHEFKSWTRLREGKLWIQTY